MSSNILFKTGDVLASECQALVNTVNCFGVMGKGVALTFKNKFPEMYIEYRKDCESRKVKLGELKFYPVVCDGSVKIVVNFPTKYHWKNNSRLEDIDAGLKFFVNNYKSLGITSVAFPKLGCTNGGLDWRIVKPLMISHLSAIDIPVEIYE